MTDDTQLCSKCFERFPADQVFDRGDEQVCTKCGKMLDFLEAINAEKEQLRASKHRKPAPPSKSHTAANAGRTADDTGSVAGAKIGPQTRANASAEKDSQGRMWFAVAVFGGDKKAARAIKDYFSRKNPKAVGRVLVPKSWQEVLRSGKYTKQYRRAMPGYLLIKCREDCLDELKRAPHVQTVLPYADPIDPSKYDEKDPIPQPVPVPKEQVAKFLSKGPKPDPTPLQIWDSVQVRAGQWEGQTGKVIGRPEEDLWEVSILILGHPAGIKEPTDNLTKIKLEE